MRTYLTIAGIALPTFLAAAGGFVIIGRISGERWYLFDKTAGCVVPRYTPKEYAELVLSREHLVPTVIDHKIKGIRTVTVIRAKDRVAVVFTNSKEFCESADTAIKTGESR